MEIRILECLAGAARAEGLAVVFDVFRATSHIVTLLARGAAGVRPVATVEEARALKATHPAWLLAGERLGLPLDGFDLGNSPYQAQTAAVADKQIILTTSAGSKGLVAAAGNAEAVLVGSFLNAEALVAAIHARAPKVLSLCAIGLRGETPTPEDTHCAEYIAARVRGETPDFSIIRDEIRAHPEGWKFLDPDNFNYMAEDFDACITLNRYSVVPDMQDGWVAGCKRHGKCAATRRATK